MSIAKKLGLLPSKRSMELFGDEPPLVRLGVRITFYCNLACTYCSADSTLLRRREVPRGQIIDTPLFKSALEQARDLGAVVLEITGGEPFLYKDLLEVLKYADDLGYITLLATNGTLINEESARVLAKLDGLNNLQITLDGSTPQVHSYTRGPTFRRVIKTLELLKRYEVPVIINTVVNKMNIHDIENIATLSKKLGAKLYKVSLIACAGRGEAARRDIGITLEDTINLAKRVHALFLEFRGEMMVGLTGPPYLMSEDMRCELREVSMCNVLIHAGLDFKGRIGPCTYYLGPGKCYELGNLKAQRLEDIWYSERFKDFRRNFIKEYKSIEQIPPCSACICREECYGVCPAEAFQRAGRWAMPPDLCQELYSRREYRWIVTKGLF